ncbi:NAD(P)/FAD-dependent oxidoreductase [Arenicella xantha]|uniref:Glycine/D-amino acid oxidase-like deaminating enzyme n=1 Tax=Arenicella xantha TaxID=644221 RepID=A0A395JPK7_9GAMM|nr:FAD-dependent oxidoreductase [Arenicella xantha]RBP53574.1 glycine/D-amino acid oxidase-like deaminating enzyme [Arenicella xantha]
MTDYDAIVIGAGLTGVATAYHLAKGGASVIVLERDQINRGASGANAGSLHFQLEHRLIEHVGVLDEELSFYAALARMAIIDWRALETELEQNIELEMTGGLMLAETAEQMTKLELKGKIESEQGLDVSLLDRAAVLNKAPYLSDSVIGALYCADEGHCNPRLLSHAFARKASALGVTLQMQTQVNALKRTGDVWSVSAQTDGEAETTYTAKVLVNAAGAWSTEVARMANLHLPLFPVGLMISVTEKAPAIMQHMIQHVGQKLSLKQVDDGNLLIGGGWSAKLPQRNGQWQSGYRAVLDVDLLQKNLATACHVMPQLAELHVLRSWTGTTGITPDQLPIIGGVDQAPGFYVAAGGSGFTYGPTYAKLLAELILSGETSFPISAYSPNRFGHMNMFMG